VLRYLEAHGTAYMVMEYSQGGSLADHLRQHGPKLPESALMRIFLPILNGVHAVHQAEVPYVAGRLLGFLADLSRRSESSRRAC